MTALTLAPVAAPTQVSFGRTFRVEVLKATDTLAARILFGVILFVTLAAVFGIPLLATYGVEGNEIFSSDFTMISVGILSLAAPLLAIMLFTSEWSQKSALSTFVTEPRRGRVLLAKTLVAVLLGVVAWALGMAIGYLGVVVFQAAGVNITWAVDQREIVGMLVTTVYGTLQGAALGLLLMNTPLAIVILLVAPNALGFLRILNETTAQVWSWIAPNASYEALATLKFTADDVPRFLVSTLIWIVAPSVVGWIRQTNAEVN